MKRLAFWYDLMHSKFWIDSQEFEYFEFCPTVGNKWNISANSVLQYTHLSNVLPSYQVKIPQDSLVSIVTMLMIGQLRNWVSISSKTKRYF